MGAPPLAVVVCTVGRSDELARLLPVLAPQAEALGAELLVVDQSDDEEHARVEALLPAGVRLIRRAPGLPAARNAGLAATTAPIVLFLDDDTSPAPGCLSAHLEPFRDPTVGGAVGRIVERRLRPNSRRLRNDLAWDGRIRVRLDTTEDGPIGSLKGANMSVRRRAVEQVGGFDEGWGGTALLEDADLSERLIRAGWRLRYAARAAVEHLHAPTGGVRQEGAEQTERWRFHNTARFLRRHRGMGGVLVATPTWMALAAARGLRWRRPGSTAQLISAWWAGARG
ncbi:MAG: glycosyltransferase family 2 protein [Alphaproteobacteria bacterium]|nr:glycosyltransferase family 2 protein [Alphaproteobacteria bacterium]